MNVCISIPTPLPFSDIIPGGDLARRATLNFSRLEEAKYQPDQVFQPAAYDWPGDTEGRTVLALTLLAQALHREPKHLEEILRRFPEHYNCDGYFGKVSLPETLDEQQLASHGWVLRGLCEEYLRTKSVVVRQMVEKIVWKLAVPTRGFHQDYPIDPGKRIFTGEYSGTVTNRIGHWLLSSDIGSDFILLDGIVQAWEVMGCSDLPELIDEIIARFLQVDLLAIKAQTHSTLTGLRAILRYAQATSRPQLVAEAEKRFRLYLGEALTENFANYNWFQRPQWTEPCAVVDSFMVATHLWQLTGKPEYLEIAHLIYFNALGHGQRANGGFGCDTCAGAHDPFLAISAIEAHWCCTMRGGEGLARAIQYSCFQTSDSIYLPFFHDAELTARRATGVLHLKETTLYPYQGHVQLEVLTDTVPQTATLFLYLPPPSPQPRIALNGAEQKIDLESGFVKWTGAFKPGDLLTYDFDTVLRQTPVTNPHSISGHYALRHGPLLLACEGSSPRQVILSGPASRDACYQVGDLHLAPLNDLIDRPEVTKENYRRQVLFPTAP
jgi:uncharacterized protein